MGVGPHSPCHKQLDRNNRNQEDEEEGDLVTVASR
jgi:hypothetical protein